MKTTERCVTALAAALLAGACGGGTGGATTTGATTSSTTTGSGSSGSTGSSSGTGGSVVDGGSTGGSTGGAMPSSAYACTDTELYQVWVPPLAMTLLGAFDCIGAGPSEDSAMTDIAVDAMGNLWGVSAHYAYQLDVFTAPPVPTVHCAKTISLQSVPSTFTALAFVPAGVIGPAEALVAGGTQGTLWTIDTTTGALEQHGTLGTVPGSITPWQLSGGLLFPVVNGMPSGFAIVDDCTTSACSETDTLLEIDTTKLAAAGTGDVTLAVVGQIVKSASCTDPINTTYGHIDGLATWGGGLYGFSHDGYVVEISTVDGSACAVAGMNTAEAWTGATSPP